MGEPQKCGLGGKEWWRLVPKMQHVYMTPQIRKIRESLRQHLNIPCWRRTGVVHLPGWYKPVQSCSVQSVRSQRYPEFRSPALCLDWRIRVGQATCWYDWRSNWTGDHRGPWPLHHGPLSSVMFYRRKITQTIKKRWKRYMCTKYKAWIYLCRHTLS